MVRPSPLFSESLRPLISVVAPAYNEQESIDAFYRRVVAVFDKLPYRLEFVLVNDGSSDGTYDRMMQLRQSDRRVAVVDLSRNFGKEIALTAGLEHAEGDAVIVIDTDLQDPPEVIPDLIAPWAEEGYDVVYGQRTERQGETFVKKATAEGFYRLMQRVGKVRIPRNSGDFRLLSRRAVISLLEMREQHRFMKGLFSWIGYPQIAVPYRREARHAGTTKWKYWGLWNFALEGITSFTTAPLRAATYLGLAVAAFAFLYGLWIIYKTLVYGADVSGYPSLMVTILFLGGVQLVALGIIGEYLGRVFNETKRRPLYFVREYRPAETEEESLTTSSESTMQ